MATKTVGVRLDADMQSRLKALAEKRDRTPHYLMKEAVEEFVHREETYETELELMDRRREHYEITGEFYTPKNVREHFQAKIAKRNDA